MDDFPPRPTPLQEAELRRRQRGRNVAVMMLLVGLVALFFAITIVKMSKS